MTSKDTKRSLAKGRPVTKQLNMIKWMKNLMQQERKADIIALILIQASPSNPMKTS